MSESYDNFWEFSTTGTTPSTAANPAGSQEAVAAWSTYHMCSGTAGIGDESRLNSCLQASPMLAFSHSGVFSEVWKSSDVVSFDIIEMKDNICRI